MVALTRRAIDDDGGVFKDAAATSARMVAWNTPPVGSRWSRTRGPTAGPKDGHFAGGMFVSSKAAWPATTEAISRSDHRGC